MEETQIPEKSAAKSRGVESRRATRSFMRNTIPHETVDSSQLPLAGIRGVRLGQFQVSIFKSRVVSGKIMIAEARCKPGLSSSISLKVFKVGLCFAGHRVLDSTDNRHRDSAANG